MGLLNFFADIFKQTNDLDLSEYLTSLMENLSHKKLQDLFLKNLQIYSMSCLNLRDLNRVLSSIEYIK